TGRGKSLVHFGLCLPTCLAGSGFRTRPFRHRTQETQSFGKPAPAPSDLSHGYVHRGCRGRPGSDWASIPAIALDLRILGASSDHVRTRNDISGTFDVARGPDGCTDTDAMPDRAGDCADSGALGAVAASRGEKLDGLVALVRARDSLRGRADV